MAVPVRPAGTSILTETPPACHPLESPGQKTRPGLQTALAGAAAAG